MTDYEKGEFFEGLGRLYNSSVALKEAREALARNADGHDNRLDRIEIILDNGMQSHEKRMQRIEAVHERVSSDREALKQRQEIHAQESQQFREELRQMSEQSRQLVETARAHERRLDRVEGDLRGNR